MRKYIRIWLLALGFAVILLVNGCQSSNNLKYTPKKEELSPVTVETGSYRDFEDIQIPSEFVLDEGKSYLYQAESIKTGVLSFTTSKPAGEVISFFRKNMPLDNWTPISLFKFRKSIMLYHKTSKNCLIIIENSDDEPAKTNVEIWVSPQGVDKKHNSLLKKVLNK